MFSLSINGIAKTYRRSSPPACLYTSKIHQPAQAAKAPVCPAPFFMEQRCSVQRLFGAGYPAPFSLETFSLPEGRRVRRAFGASRGGNDMETKYDRLKTFVAGKGWPRYRFNQILHAIFKERIGEFRSEERRVGKGRRRRGSREEH